MASYFGIIAAAQGFGKPISLYLEIKGHNQFLTLARRLHREKIMPYLQEKNWILHSANPEGFAQVGDASIEYAIVAKDVGLEDRLDPGMPVKKIETKGEEMYAPNYSLKAHEENHKEIMSLGLWDMSKYAGPARAYFDILTESLADVLGDLATLSHHDDKKMMKEYMLRRARFGWTLLGIVSDAQHGKSHLDLAERIRKGYDIMPSFREDPTWADILFDVKYNGLYLVCLDVIRTHGEEKGKDIVYETIHKLQNNPDALDALFYLQQNLPDPLFIPLIKELNITQSELHFSHAASSGDSRFKLLILCADDPIPLSYAKSLIARTTWVTDVILPARQNS